MACIKICNNVHHFFHKIPEKPLVKAIFVMLKAIGNFIAPDKSSGNSTTSSAGNSLERDFAKKILKKHKEFEKGHFEKSLKKATRLAALLYKNAATLKQGNELAADISFTNDEDKKRFYKRLFKLSFKAIMEIKTNGPKKRRLCKYKSPALRKLFGKGVYQLRGNGLSFIAVQNRTGSGTFNKVYHAVDILKGEFRAVRVFRRRNTLEDLDYLIKENKLHMAICKNSQLKDGTLKIYDTFYTHPFYGSVLEYCNGGNLADELMKGLLTNEHKADLIPEIFYYMRDAHQQGIVLGDPKLENILLHNEDDGQSIVSTMKFTDFGGAFYKKKPPQLCIVSPSYVAPENFQNYATIQKYSIKTDEFTDIWALGILLYEMKYAKDNDEDTRIPQFIVDALEANDDFSDKASKENCEKALQIMTEGLANLGDYLDLDDPYDAIIAGLLKLNPQERLTIDQALIQLKDVPLASYSKK